MTFWRSFPREGEVGLGPGLEYAKRGGGYMLVCAWSPLMVLDFEGVKKWLSVGYGVSTGCLGGFWRFLILGISGLGGGRGPG